jgi:hypothetical protein
MHILRYLAGIDHRPARFSPQALGSVDTWKRKFSTGEVDMKPRQESVSSGRLIVVAGILLEGIMFSSVAAAQSTISGQVKDTRVLLSPEQASRLPATR